MSLKALKIKFQRTDDLFAEINNAAKNKHMFVDSPDTLIFDEPKTWRNFMTSQKFEILTTIARLRPSSVYKLAQNLDRASQHVLKDCRELETFGLIVLAESGDVRKSLRPELKFDYDFIRVAAPIQNSLPVSEQSIRLLDNASA